MRTLYSDEDIDVSVEEYDEFYEGVFIHTNVKQFSLSKYKKFKHIWIHVRAGLRLEGYKYVLALPPGDKERKWESMFGFEPTGIFVKGQEIMRVYI